ncbi:MAG TPA: hypothetical protein QGG93_03840 [Verrucomicrobiota bacterium]|nr:hypothetical protein [Verrucomicrobiota bacterium]
MVDSATKRNAPGPLRLAISFLSLLLTIFFIWLLSFLLNDIGNLPGPDYNMIQKRHIPTERQAAADHLREQLTRIEKPIKRQEEIQDTLQQSMSNAETALTKIADLQRLSLEGGGQPSEVDRQAMENARSRFYKAQDEFESANATIISLKDERHQLKESIAGINAELSEFRDKALAEYSAANSAYELKIASLKLALVVPLLLLSAWLVRKKRGSIYQPFNGAALAATFWMVWLVMWDHFPRDFFKYIAILAAIGILGAFLAWSIRSAARPRRAMLLKRHREAYQNHRCPACDFPILRGAFQQAVWTKRGPKFHREAPSQTESSRYTCPSCGEGLFDKCGDCGEVTQTLLPYCSACGQENEPAG